MPLSILASEVVNSELWKRKPFVCALKIEYIGRWDINSNDFNDFIGCSIVYKIVFDKEICYNKITSDKYLKCENTDNI